MPLADEILFGALREGGHAEVDYVAGKVVVRAIAAPKPEPAPEAPEPAGAEPPDKA